MASPTLVEHTPHTLAAQVRRQHAELMAAATHLPGVRGATAEAGLRAVVAFGMGFRLEGPAAAAFRKLGTSATLAGLEPLPCCADHDEHIVDAWVTGVLAIVDADKGAT